MIQYGQSRNIVQYLGTILDGGLGVNPYLKMTLIWLNLQFFLYLFKNITVINMIETPTIGKCLWGGSAHQTVKAVQLWVH